MKGRRVYIALLCTMSTQDQQRFLVDGSFCLSLPARPTVLVTRQHRTSGCSNGFCFVCQKKVSPQNYRANRSNEPENENQQIYFTASFVTNVFIDILWDHILPSFARGGGGAKTKLKLPSSVIALAVNFSVKLIDIKFARESSLHSQSKGHIYHHLCKKTFDSWHFLMSTWNVPN